MKLKLKLSELLCIALLVSSGSGSPYERKAPAGKEKRVQYAAWDDVNVLAHGLLQLGQSLKEHVDKTKGQMRDISVKLQVFNGSVSELAALTRRLHEESEALKARAQSLEERENRILNMSSEMQEKTGELLKDRQRAHDRLVNLEGKVDRHALTSSNHSDAHAIQVYLFLSNKLIKQHNSRQLHLSPPAAVACESARACVHVRVGVSARACCTCRNSFTDQIEILLHHQFRAAHCS